MVLIALFIPAWTALGFLSVPSTEIRFRLRATGEVLTPGGNQITEITGVLNAVTLIIGFMMFAATFTGGHFDRRLALAKLPPHPSRPRQDHRPRTGLRRRRRLRDRPHLRLPSTRTARRLRRRTVLQPA